MVSSSVYRLIFVSLVLALSAKGWSQGWENFNHSNATSSYRDGSFTGNNSIQWNYISARDENGDANNSGIDGKALMLRNMATDSKVFAENIPNGIKNFRVKLYKGFSAAGTRKVELFINGISYGESEGFDDFEEHLFEVENININGDFILEIRNITSRQIIIDDIVWTAFDGSELPPSITDIQQIPQINNVTPLNSVTVSATISSAKGIQSAELHWGLDSGNLSNSIELVAVAQNLYTTVHDIPEQPDGTTVFYRIIAQDNEGNTATSSEINYEVHDPIWLSIPYFNSFRTEDDWLLAHDENFYFNGINHESAGDGYLKMNSGGFIITPSIDFDEHPIILTHFDLATWGGIRNQKLTVSISDDNGESFLPLNSYLVDFPNAAYGTFAQYIDASQLNGRIGRIKYEKTGGSGSIRFRDLNIETFNGYVYDNEWFPSDPYTNSTFEDDIFILNGTTRFRNTIEAKNLFINEDAILYVDAILDIHGNKILVDGDLIFAATENSDGELAFLHEETQLRGDVTVEKYFMNKPAFRMISSPITTSNAIRDNWQEGVNNTSADPQHNQNPNPGYGTHITGNIFGEYGFDATEDGSPSLFEENVLTQEFIPIENTDENKIQNGYSYLIFIRGDRGINLSNPDDSSETILRTKGKMEVGDRTKMFPTMNSGEFGMFGNPYQSAVDVKQLFTFDSEKININHYYVYDANLADYGAYVMVNLFDGTNFFESEANGFLQPGQAAKFITVDYGGPALYFKEEHKFPGNHTAINRGGESFLGENHIRIQLFTRENFENNGAVHDAIALDFNRFYTNSITHADAIKPMNFFENLAVDHDGLFLIKEQREMPITGDVFPLFINGYQHREYVLKMRMNGFEDAVIYLDDSFNRNSTLFMPGEIAYFFEVDPNNPQSLASDRFLIRVEHRLHIEKHEKTKIILFPNPVDEEVFSLSGLENIPHNFRLIIRDAEGRELLKRRITSKKTEIEIQLPSHLQSGFYFVEIESDEIKQTFKIIKN